MRYLLFFLICFSSITFAQEESPLITQVSSTQLIEGEEATLSLIFRNERPKQSPPKIIPIGNDQVIRLKNTGSQNLNGARFYIYQYDISLLPVGRYTIPELKLDFNGQMVQSQSVDLEVSPLSVLTPNHFDYRDEQGDKKVTFYSRIFVNKTTLYPGEAVPVEYKVYIPHRMQPQGFGIPQAAEIFNATAWRFNTPTSRRELGRVNINGLGHHVASYTTVLSALKPGDAVFGPLETTLVVMPRGINSRFGFIRQTSMDVPLKSEQIGLEVIEFPSAPPAGFQGAVGDLQIEASLPAKTVLSTNDSINVTVTVSGSGNLSELAAPELNNPTAWNVIDVSRVEQGDERKRLEGSVQFSYLLQPLAAAHFLPRFSLTHFNLPSKSWKTDITASSAVTINEAISTPTVSPAALTTESMHDILGPLAKVNLTPAAHNVAVARTPWVWQSIPALILLPIFLLGLLRKRQRASSVPPEQKSEWQALNTKQDAAFIKAAANYASRWSPQSELAAKLSSLRDTSCYTPGQSSQFSRSERSKILQSLKKLGLILMLLSLIPDAQANGFEAWQAKQYPEALAHYQTLAEQHPNSADLHYNIACCYYRLGQFGEATRHFFTALELNPAHVEAKKNLKFIQSSHASIVAEQADTTNPWLSGLSPERCLIIAASFTWIVLCCLALRLHLPQSKRTLNTLASTALALAILSVGIWWIHPLRGAEPPIETNCILVRSTPLLTEPIQPSDDDIAKKTLITAKLASPARRISEIDQWAYIELANGSRGWIKRDSISEPLQQP